MYVKAHLLGCFFTILISDPTENWSLRSDYIYIRCYIIYRYIL